MKRTQTLAALAAVGALLAAARVEAAGSARAGTSGGQELRIPVGPRGTALSGSSIADAVGVEALYWNPAGAASAEGTEILFSTMSYLVDSDVHYAGVTREFAGIGTVGFAVKALDLGDIAVTTEAAGGETGEQFSPSSSVIGLTYARTLTDRVALGITANLVTESIRNEQATGFAFDVGVQYALPARGMRFGAVMKSFGPKMRFEGPDFGFATEPPGGDPSASPRTVVTESAAFELPSSFRVGVSYDAFQSESGSLRLLTGFESSTFAESSYRFGAEYMWRDALVFRGGVTASGADESPWGATFGGGVRAPLGSARVEVDYTRQSMSEFFDDQNLVGLKILF
jgi:long-subunit fatty acid transport protein